MYRCRGGREKGRVAMHADGWWWHMGWMWVFWVVLLIMIVVIVQWAAASARPSSDAGPSAEAILKRRYAQGEIGQEEYERKLQDLRK